MGRPIRASFFGKYNLGGTGGEGVTSVAIAGTNTGYWSANASVTFTTPQITGGVVATGTVGVWGGNGAIANVTMTSPGSGYTSAPTVAFLGANTGLATGTATLTSNQPNAITANAWIAGDTLGRASDIIKQVGSRRFRIQNITGTDNCRLVTTANPAAAGEMTITATFAGAQTFSIANINEHTVTDADGNRYLWNDYSSTTTGVVFATASNATTPPTVTITNV